MWKLQTPSEQLTTWYKNTMLDGLYSRVKHLEQNIQDVLIPKNTKGKDDKSILEHLLVYKPIELHKLCDDLMKQIIPNYDENEFEDYLKAKGKKNHRNRQETILFKKYSDILKKLLDAFDYNGQLSNNKSRSYKLAMAQGQNTCVYCNRQYVITISNKDNNAGRIVRPHLDHWFSKELYPLMSLSLYNLIPCCSICNSSIKGNSIFNFKTHIHPYLDSTPNEPNFKFQGKFNSDGTCSVICDNVTDKKEECMLKTFEIEKIYSYHGELEVKDILLFLQKYPNAYLSHLLNETLKNYGYSESDVYRMFFGAELLSSKNLNRPFSKLKRDILIQFGIIKDEHFKI